MRFSKWTPPADLDALMTAAAVVVRCVFECLVCLDRTGKARKASIHSSVDSRDPLWFNQASKARQRQMHPELKERFAAKGIALDCCYFQSEFESPCPWVCFFFQVYLTLELLCTE